VKQSATRFATLLTRTAVTRQPAYREKLAGALNEAFQHGTAR
jgi:hypothetical protein